MCLRSRLVVGIMCICTAAALLTGCSSSGSSAPKEIVKTEEKAGDTAASAEETSDEQEAADEQESPDTEADTAAEDSNKGDITIEEQVLVEQDGIKITALDYCDALIVNDYMIDDLFGSEVAAGKKANDVIYLSSSELKAAGIDTVGRIEIYFHAFDADSYDEIFNTDCVTIETSAIDSMDTKANDEGTELYNEDGIRIIGKTVDEKSFSI